MYKDARRFQIITNDETIEGCNLNFFGAYPEDEGTECNIPTNIPMGDM